MWRTGTLIAPLPLAANMLGGQRNIPKSQRSRRIFGARGTKRLSERTGFNSASSPTVVVFAPGLSRGNRPGDAECDSGNSNQHLLPAHDSLLRFEWRRASAATHGGLVTLIA